ncbi:MAG: M28 family peptidase [Planctomycetes bacterium]|nr:M28 family peptidase [Planctomycetota bacterium]MCB9885023.1 M28 family peptidase [Planctomycetota bacterium]
MTSDTFARRPLPVLSLAAALTLGAFVHAQNDATEISGAVVPASKPLPADRAKGSAAVTVEDCKTWLYTLASPEFEGRQTGYPGFQKAADLVAAHFKKLGLEARGEDGSYFQTVPWTTNTPIADKTFVSFSKDGREVMRIPAERLAGSASANATSDGDVVLLTVVPPKVEAGGGRRMRVPEIPGLADIDVEGKAVVLYLVGDDADPTSLAMARFGVQRALAGKNAAIVLTAQKAPATGGLRGRSGPGRGTGRGVVGGRRAPLDATFGGDDLTALLAAAGTDDAALSGDQLTRALPLHANVSVALEEVQGPAMNVWAVLPGSDPKLKDEYVVIGSHLDHVGMRGGLHPGADDDGSGTTGVLAVSTMFVNNPIKPRRSVLFLCFCGEEDGLIGSRYFSQNPPIPLEAIAAELQMDMIGRDEEENREGDRGEKAEDNVNSLHLVGTQKLAPALHALCLRKNETAQFSIEYDQEGMFGRSDHANFARMGVPIAFFFTGLHKDYHETTDTPDKINFPKLLRVANYVYDIAFDLAQADDRPLVEPDLWNAYRGKGRDEPAAPVSRDR